MPLTGSRRRWIVAAVVLAVLALFALLATRALSGPEQGADPALVTPSNAGLYVGLDLRPEGSQGENAKEALGRILGDADDPDRALAGTLDPLLAAVGGGGAALRWETDVRPWLGRRAAFFAVSLSERPSYAVVLEAADEDAAERALGRLDAAEAPRATRREHRGVPYAVRGDGLAWAMVDGFAVLGTERGVRASIEASKRFALGRADRFTQAVAPREAPLALLYVDLNHLVEAVPPALLGGRRGAEEVNLRLARVEDKPYVISVSAPDARGFAVDFSSPPGKPDPDSPPTQVGGGLDGTALLPTRLLPRMPADALFAWDFPEAGQRLYDAFTPAVNPGLPNRSLGEMEERFRRRSGIDIERDVISWLGTVGGFVAGPGSGGREGGLSGAVVAESLDPATSRRTVRRVGRYLGTVDGMTVGPLDLEGAGGPGFSLRREGLPGTLYVYARGNRVVAGLGAVSAVEALDAPRKLGAVAAYRRAARELGGSLLPGAWLSPPAATEAAGALGADRHLWFRLAAPYLERLSYALYGSKRNKRRILVGAG